MSNRCDAVVTFVLWTYIMVCMRRCCNVCIIAMHSGFISLDVSCLLHIVLFIWWLHSIFVYLQWQWTSIMRSVEHGQYVVYREVVTVKKLLIVCVCFWRRLVWCAFSCMKQWSAVTAFVYSFNLTFPLYGSSQLKSHCMHLMIISSCTVLFHPIKTTSITISISLTLGLRLYHASVMIFRIN